MKSAGLKFFGHLCPREVNLRSTASVDPWYITCVIRVVVAVGMVGMVVVVVVCLLLLRPSDVLIQPVSTGQIT